MRRKIVSTESLIQEEFKVPLFAVYCGQYSVKECPYSLFNLIWLLAV